MLIVHLISTQSAQFTVLARYGYLKQLALELMKYLRNYLKINLKSVFLCVSNLKQIAKSRPKATKKKCVLIRNVSAHS